MIDSRIFEIVQNIQLLPLFCIFHLVVSSLRGEREGLTWVSPSLKGEREDLAWVSPFGEREGLTWVSPSLRGRGRVSLGSHLLSGGRDRI